MVAQNIPEAMGHWEWVRVDRTMAETWLASGPNYRDRRNSWCSDVEDSIKAFGWNPLAGFFIIADGGRLLDGQHRCSVIMEHDLSVMAWVLVVPKCLAHLVLADQNNPRRVVDDLKSVSEQLAGPLSAALNLLWRYDQTGRLCAGYSIGPRRFYIQQARATLIKHPDLRESVRLAENARRKCYGLQSALVSVIHYLAGKQNAGAADLWVKKLGDGDELGRNDPIYLLRKALLKGRTSLSSRLGNKERAALTIKCWNAWYAGKELNLLTWRGVGPAAEDFPRLVLGTHADSQKESRV